MKINIEDNQIIEHSGVDKKYLEYIENILKLKKLSHKYSYNVTIEKDIYYFSNLNILELILDIAACQDQVYSYYLKTQWNTPVFLKDCEKYFPKIVEDQSLIGVIVQNDIKNNILI